MYRRHFLSLIPSTALMGLGLNATAVEVGVQKPFNGTENPEDRKYWVNVMTRIAAPVLNNLSKGTLKKNMPVEVNPASTYDRTTVTYLEAFGRLMAGMAPWLELGVDGTEEGKLRGKYILLARESLANAVDPMSPDFMQFTSQKYEQALVDASFLAQALIRAPKELWEPLSAKTKSDVIKALKSTRNIKPTYNNWLLFTAMIESFLMRIDEDADVVRIDYAIKKLEEWYKGDGIYGDGPKFHFDYYNSYVIHPMLMDIVKTVVDKGLEKSEVYDTILKRAIRYADIQERSISPEGTFPPVGRSLVYRFGALQGLAQIALINKLPPFISPAQVRGAMSLVIKRMIEAPGTFDKNGWLTIGFCGHQIDLGEYYMSTGSLYLCTVGLLPLGLPPKDVFWTAAQEPWTAKKIWGGVNMPADHSIP
ncbi:hypothetical protein SAMN04487898_113144 [Pedobacter sp. ok626]|uniref:DUF2264 domain-containing protein n=1 Tax=Pedobacter sp. ok626 TaxID=1761882 RepID=UPI00088BDA67|nr:DUF2264 domain-containing protein [Pedobacter sp. ok626]SDK96463.1 hypothetical protein SAMN04487898_113144 [Pedobacter sp. ok626]